MQFVAFIWPFIARQLNIIRKLEIEILVFTQTGYAIQKAWLPRAQLLDICRRNRSNQRITNLVQFSQQMENTSFQLRAEHPGRR